MSDFDDEDRSGRSAAHITYALYAVSLFSGLPMFLGVIVAYVTRGGARPRYRDHLSYAISTFWWSLLWLVLGLLLWVVLIGYVFLALAWVYTAWRTVRGWLRLLDERRPPGY
ncbi:MAG: hypothetical protein KDE35_17355 [Geminicoccaceae bacterium]|nr:hypothetical protein [Geminicoccaceae bacterium]